MIDFYVQREVLKAHTDCPAVLVTRGLLCFWLQLKIETLVLFGSCGPAHHW